MKREEIINTFILLSQSQGFYGRLLNLLNTMEAEKKEAFLTILEDQNFKDMLDLIMWIEENI